MCLNFYHKWRPQTWKIAYVKEEGIFECCHFGQNESAVLRLWHITDQAGPSPGFSRRGGQKPKRGAKNQKRGHIFKIQYWMYAATGGPNAKWAGTDFKCGGGHHWPPRWRRTWDQVCLVQTIFFLAPMICVKVFRSTFKASYELTGLALVAKVRVSKASFGAKAI